jgi:probable HAF family extracellular repeat protein
LWLAELLHKIPDLLRLLGSSKFLTAIPLRVVRSIPQRGEVEIDMKFRKWMWTITVFLFAVLAMPLGMAAQDKITENHKAKHRMYKLIDLGTLGGPNSSFPNPLTGFELTNMGHAVVEADTTTPDPYAQNCWQETCLINHTFSWHDGVKIDLGALSGVNNSIPFATNTRGQTIGVSENGLFDPLTGFPEARAVLWQDGEILDLGTFGGNNAIANSINTHGQVVGGAQNAIPDSFAFCDQPFAFATQVHAFSWQDGAMRDLGTLGGDDSCALILNDQGQVAGFSYTNSTANPNTGIPTLDPFLWERGTMRDLGSLGGTVGFPNWINNFGQVVGQSDLAGDQLAHPFFWSRDGGMRDLGTLGGDTGFASWVNDAGEVIGQADLQGSGPQLHHGFVWKNGKMTDLGTVDGDPCSRALSINSQGQITGASTNCTEYQHAFLWENGGPMIDLNSLIHPGSALTVREGDEINDRGEIAGEAVLPNGDPHAVLLVPDGDCDEECEVRIATSQKNATVAAQASPITSTTIRKGETKGPPINSLGYRFGRRYNLPGQRAVPLY